MTKKKFLESVTRYTLIILFVLIFLGSVFISFINPESYFFGEKLGGTKAITYLLINGSIGILIAWLLLMKKNRGEFLSVLYFGYNFIEALVTNVISFGVALISPLFTTGLIASIVRCCVL